LLLSRDPGLKLIIVVNHDLKTHIAMLCSAILRTETQEGLADSILIGLEPLLIMMARDQVSFAGERRNQKLWITLFE